jgi:hypothetical protein
MNATTPEQFARFVDLCEIGYNLQLRELFVQEARAFLHRLAEDLRLTPGSCRFHFERGGVGSSGEAILQHPRFCMRLDADHPSPEGKWFAWWEGDGRDHGPGGRGHAVYFHELRGDGYGRLVAALREAIEIPRIAA